jgi:hypothetical protein
MARPKSVFNKALALKVAHDLNLAITVKINKLTLHVLLATCSLSSAVHARTSAREKFPPVLLMKDA